MIVFRSDRPLASLYVLGKYLEYHFIDTLTLRQIERLEQAGGPAGLSSVLAGN